METAVKEKMIIDIMKTFDFEKVHNIMLTLNWKWLTEKNKMAIPSIYELIKQGEELLREVIDKAKEYDYDNFEIQTRGFIASIKITEEKEYILSLKFVLEENTSYSNDYK